MKEPKSIHQLETEMINKLQEAFSLFLEWKHERNLSLPDSNNFYQYRMELGLSMDQVAKESGISKSTISRVEKGGKAQYNTVKKLYEFYQKKLFNNNQLKIK